MTTTMTFKISGMHCSSCEKLIDMELSDLPGVAKAQTSFNKGETRIEAEESFDTQQAIKTIATLGYQATPMQEKSSI